MAQSALPVASWLSKKKGLFVSSGARNRLNYRKSPRIHRWSHVLNDKCRNEAKQN